IGGLAIEDSILTTTLEALRCGYRVILLEDALRGRELAIGDSLKAMEEMQRCGAEVITLEKLKCSLS
ncbi:MAG: isochorismatase family protein, partial [Deltaproteobacteria bacterium]|nr:isochorismatase family protein [Deltaproteobacteria bacterium]